MILEAQKLSRDFRSNFLIHVVLTWLLASIQLIPGHVWRFKGESTDIPGASVETAGGMGSGGSLAYNIPVPSYMVSREQGVLTIYMEAQGLCRSRWKFPVLLSPEQKLPQCHFLCTVLAKAVRGQINGKAFNSLKKTKQVINS